MREVTRRPSGWQKVSEESRQKSGKEAEIELKRIERLFQSLFGSEVGREFEGMLVDEIGRSMISHRAATTMEQHKYYLGRWDLAEEFLSFKRGLDIRVALVASAVDRALKAKEEK